jgi:hypothetical protein
MSVEVQSQILEPAVASVSKNCSPTTHVAGVAVPAFAGFVLVAEDASHAPRMVLLPFIVV